MVGYLGKRARDMQKKFPKLTRSERRALMKVHDMVKPLKITPKSHPTEQPKED